MTSGKAARWRVLGKSVCGAAHLRKGWPNQDSLRLRTTPPWMLALADGHGSERCFRSEHGARYATELALELGRGFDASLSPSALKSWVEHDLPRNIVQRWCEKVDRHIAAKPFNQVQKGLLGVERSLSGVEANTGFDSAQPAAGSAEPTEAIPHSPRGMGVVRGESTANRARLAYGSTLLLVVVTAGFIFYLQLGDGDILTVSSTGQVSRPLPKDALLIANETTSLCMAQAWREVRTAFQVLADDPPALILAATDGYANSFRDEASFQQVGSDLLNLIRQEGLTVVEQNLEAWLHESSQAGSGDDITLGLMYRQSNADRRT